MCVHSYFQQRTDIQMGSHCAHWTIINIAPKVCSFGVMSKTLRCTTILARSLRRSRRRQLNSYWAINQTTVDKAREATKLMCWLVVCGCCSYCSLCDSLAMVNQRQIHKSLYNFIINTHTQLVVAIYCVAPRRSRPTKRMSAECENISLSI